MASIQVVAFSLGDICVTVVFQTQQLGSKNQQLPSHHHHRDKWLPRWNGNTPEVMSQWNFSPLSFGWLHQVRGYHALTWRPTETLSFPMFSSGPLPQGLQTSFSAYFHSKILAFLLPPQQLPLTWGGAGSLCWWSNEHARKYTQTNPWSHWRIKQWPRFVLRIFSLRGGLAFRAVLQIAHCVGF